MLFTPIQHNLPWCFLHYPTQLLSKIVTFTDTLRSLLPFWRISRYISVSSILWVALPQGELPPYQLKNNIDKKRCSKWLCGAEEWLKEFKFGATSTAQCCQIGLQVANLDTFVGLSLRHFELGYPATFWATYFHRIMLTKCGKFFVWHKLNNVNSKEMIYVLTVCNIDIVIVVLCSILVVVLRLVVAFVGVR